MNLVHIRYRRQDRIGQRTQHTHWREEEDEENKKQKKQKFATTEMCDVCRYTWCVAVVQGDRFTVAAVFILFSSRDSSLLPSKGVRGACGERWPESNVCNELYRIV